MPDLTPGVPSALSPLVRRIVAPNPGPFTGAGTNTYLVGIDEVAVIDPGPDDQTHIEQPAITDKQEQIGTNIVVRRSRNSPTKRGKRVRHRHLAPHAELLLRWLPHPSSLGPPAGPPGRAPCASRQPNTRPARPAVAAQAANSAASVQSRCAA